MEFDTLILHMSVKLQTVVSSLEDQIRIGPCWEIRFTLRTAVIQAGRIAILKIKIGVIFDRCGGGRKNHGWNMRQRT